MKKLRILILTLVFVLCLGLAGCGKKIEAPTVADVEKALKDEGYLPKSEKDDDDDKKKDKKEEADDEDSKDEDSKDDEKSEESKDGYEIKIEKSKLNDDKDKATLDVVLVQTEGSIEKTTEFDMTFKLKDDKETWKIKSIDKGDVEEKLSKGITEEELKKGLKYAGYQLNDDVYVSAEDVEKLSIEKNELVAAEMKDMVTVNIEGKRGIREFKASAEVECSYMSYDNSWSCIVKKIVSSDVKFADSYKFELKEDDIVAAIKADENSTVYFLSRRVPAKEINFSGIKYDPVTLNGETYISVEATGALEFKGITSTATMTLRYQYDANDGWKLESVRTSVDDNYDVPVAGKYAGTGTFYPFSEETPVNMAMEITKNSDGKYSAVLNCTSSDANYDAFTLNMEVKSFYLTEDYRIQFSARMTEVVTKPSNANIYSFSLNGYYDGKTFGADNFSMTKQ